MPTPFYHLDVAETLLADPALPSGIRDFLHRNSAPFLFGHVAPDVQTVSKHGRARTHFYKIPIRPADSPPWRRIFREHPALAPLSAQPPQQAAFIAGYLCHLQADWLWTRDIFDPVFGPRASWRTLRERLYLHNVLRSYLDLKVLENLNGTTRPNLEAARPDAWLPFVEDRHLEAWRDLLAEQLQPGSVIQTVEIFATRQRISPAEYYILLNSEPALDEAIFSHLRRDRLALYRRDLMAHNLSLLQAYLNNLESEFC